jgi:hypothetical protein
VNFLMLRGQVPTDRNPQEIVFDTLKEVDDMWTLLFYNLMDPANDVGELWYWGGTREKQFTPHFIERWVPSFATYHTSFEPDVIFCRGGFQQYHAVLKQHPKAIKIYYGAGRRFLPQPGFLEYDLILQDSTEQLKLSKFRHPEAESTLFIKPAADNIFYPMTADKKYDVCFPANGKQAFKGHDFVYKTVPKHLKVLNLGNKSKVKVPNNVTSYRVVRPKMRENIVQCKMGIVAVNSNIDSCPRVIPEMLACNLPIVVRSGTRFWVDKYIKSGVTGEEVGDNYFWNAVDYVLNHLDEYSPAEYYRDNLSLRHAGAFLREKINEISIQRNK